MCGIFGYVGPRNGIALSLEGLSKIEYRGYDSAGIGFIENGAVVVEKAVGKLPVLEKMVRNRVGHTVVAHTRWATHGKVTAENAHPITDATGTFAVVHNGIIENFQQLRKELEIEGVEFKTDTDTEVIPHLLAKLYEGDLLAALQQALLLLKGTYAVAVIHKNHPGECVVASLNMPLVIGVGVGESFIASDPNAIVHHTREVIYVKDGEVARVTPESVELFDAKLTQISKKVDIIMHNADAFNKGEYEHYTLKEIFEQQQTIKNALHARFFEEYGTVALDELHLKPAELLAIKRIVIVACGTSMHAGMVASYLIEELARIPTSVEISSEYRYKNPIVEEGTLAFAISQSGETADTLAAVRELKAKGATVIGICNVPGSTLAREASSCLFLRAGPEIGVCSTKAFTSQLAVLTLFALMMGRLRHLSKQEGQLFLHDLSLLPQQIASILGRADEIRLIAEKYLSYENFFFIGRRYMFPSSLEGALKLKEIAYVNANGYAAGEMKHGPIALISEMCPTVALCADALTVEKAVSNVMETKARNGKVIAVGFEGDESILPATEDRFLIPRTRDQLAPILVAVFCQLFAYFFAKGRGAEIDQPKNLAKSVTVE